MKYRLIPIISINLFFVFLIIKTLFFDSISDTNGIFAVLMFIILMFFNVYAVLLYILTDKNNILYEILYYVFIVISIILLYKLGNVPDLAL